MTDSPREDAGASDTGREPPEPSTDALRRLEERLDRASRAAERLIAEARAEVGSDAAEGASHKGAKPPPAGWQAPKSASEDGRELELLAQLIQSVRDLLPPDLQHRLAEAVRELLLALRALIDFYLERLERRSAPPAEMEDIPIS